jgi:hypothetical protein
VAPFHLASARRVPPQASSRAARNTVRPASDPVDAIGTEPLDDGVEPEPGDVVDGVPFVVDVVVDDVDEVVDVDDVVVVVVDGGGAVVVVVADPVTSNSTPFGSWVPPSLSVAPKNAV